MVCTFNLRAISQAERRGFDSRLPLQSFNDLGRPIQSVLHLYSTYLTREGWFALVGCFKTLSSASTASLRLARAVWVYTFKFTSRE